jgi:hypothetical protein
MKKSFHNWMVRSMSLVAICCTTTISFAQTQAQPTGQSKQARPRHEGHDHAGHDQDHAHGKETIAFQLPQWKTMHFEDAAKAKQHADMVAKLGCEVKQGQHAGHIDLTYRCVQWKSMAVETHQLADQWCGWLKGSGFDVSYAHPDPAYAEGNEVVEFRLVNWKLIHGKGAVDDKKLVDMLSKLGCEVVETAHAGHADIRFRAPTWRDVHVADHKTADELGTWLKKNGFEVAPHKH